MSGGGREDDREGGTTATTTTLFEGEIRATSVSGHQIGHGHRHRGVGKRRDERYGGKNDRNMAGEVDIIWRERLIPRTPSVILHKNSFHSSTTLLSPLYS